MREQINKMIIVFFLLVLAITVFAGPTPEGPLISVINSSTRSPYVSQSLNAIAGNVSQLNLFAYTQTRTWQGYYGNISGKITLDDSLGHKIYDWNLASPAGQIFASTEHVDFSDGNIECYNFTKDDPGYLTLSDLEESLGLTSTSADGINETFNLTTLYDPFYVSTTYINKTCPVVYLYNSTNESSRDTYQELLLYDNAADNVIYTSIIKQQGTLGFNDQVWDFEMIVGENGHNGDNSPTTYYFYVSLE